MVCMLLNRFLLLLPLFAQSERLRCTSLTAERRSDAIAFDCRIRASHYHPMVALTLQTGAQKSQPKLESRHSERPPAAVKQLIFIS